MDAAGNHLPRVGQQTVPQVVPAQPPAPVATQPVATKVGSKKSFLQSFWFWLIIVLFLLAFLASLLYYLFLRDSIFAFNQPVGSAVLIKRASLSKKGYIIVHQANQFGLPEVVLGQTVLLPPGTYSDIYVDIGGLTFDGVNYEPKRGDTFFASIYFDEGDGLFDEQRDILVKNILGQSLRKKITFE